MHDSVSPKTLYINDFHCNQGYFYANLAFKSVWMKYNFYEIQEVKLVAAELNITPVIIQGEELKEKGFGGLYININCFQNLVSVSIMQRKIWKNGFLTIVTRICAHLQIQNLFCKS